MNSLKSFLKNNKYHGFVIGTIIVLHLQFVFKNQSLLIFYGDSFEQQLQYQLGAWLRLVHLNFSAWDWTLGYGANYLSKIDNIVGSPFLYLSLFFKYSVLPYLFVYFYMIKMILIYIVGYKWLSKVSSSQILGILGSVLLTFSGWVMFYYHYSYFLEGFIFFPWILYAIERYREKRTFALLVLLVFSLSVVNFYFAYMFLPFAFLYFLLRTYIMEGTIQLRSVLTYLGFLFVGVGMAGFILLPLANIILSTPRLEGIATNPFELISKFDVFRYVSSLYSPVMERFDPSYFISTTYDKGIGWGGGVSTYSFLLFPLLAPFMFTHLKGRVRKGIVISYSILLFLASFVLFHRLLQGSYDVRWFYMFTLLNVYTMVELLKEHQRQHFSSRSIFLSFLISIGLILALSYFSLKYGFYGSEQHLASLKKIVLFDGLSLLLYVLFLSQKRFKIERLLVLVMCEAILSYSIPLATNPPIEGDILKQQLASLMDRSVVETLQNEDKGFYRIVKDNQDYLNQNEPYAQDYLGVSFYSSVYNYEQQAYLNRFNETYSIPVTMGRDNSFLMTSVKYYVSETDLHTAPFGFEYWKTIGNSRVYRNRYFVPVGFIQTTTLNQSVFEQQSYLNQDRLLLNHVVLPVSSNTSLNYLNELMVYGTNIHTSHYYFGDSNAFKNSMVYIENNNISGITVRSSIQSTYLRDDVYNQYFYFSKYFDSESTVDAIEILAPETTESEPGYSIYLDTDLSYYRDWYDQLSQNFMSVDFFKGDRLSGSIDVTSDNGWLVTTIPYDKGWRVKVDGEKVSTTNVNLGFIGFPLAKGKHTIEFSYSTPYSKEGFIISGFSILIFILALRHKNLQAQLKV